MLLRWFLFPGHLLPVHPHAGSGVRGLEKLSIGIPGGTVEAWFLPADGLVTGQPAPLVIFAHGNGELIEHWPAALDPYRRMGVHVLLPEYRGYGRSAGVPSQSAIVEDYIRFYDLACARPDVDRSRVIFHGRSLGGGVVCALARSRTPAAMVLESTFTSIPDVARRWLVPGALIADKFDNASVVCTLDVPMLVLHGTADGVVPFVHGLKLSQLGRRARLVRFDCDHNDLPREPAGYWTEIRHFLDKMAAPPQSIARGPRRQG